MIEPRSHALIKIPIVRIPHRSEEGLPERCAECGGALNVTQPDAVDPDHLLATCDDCGAWYVMAWREYDDHGIMARVSEWAAYRAAIDQDGTGPRDGPK
jgi:hypothetical protein